jgi:S-adenosyl methyltransferase
VTDVSSTPGEPDAAAGAGIDTTVSHSARIWDYWLGGKDNYQVDREVGDRIEEMLPDIVRQAREDRLFLGRVVRYLAGEARIRQFLDIGTGLPTAARRGIDHALAARGHVVRRTRRDRPVRWRRPEAMMRHHDITHATQHP